MNKYIRYFQVFFLFCVIFLGYLAYNQPSQQNEETTLHLYLQGEPLSLDPRIGCDKRSQLVLRHLFEGLTRISKNGSIELALAKSYSISSDGLIYTFHLNDTSWSNGLKLTAHDFCYAWKSVLDPSFNSLYSYHFFIIKNAKRAKMGECSLDDVGVIALDDSTLQVTLDHPSPSFLELTSNPLLLPLCKSVIQTNPHWPKHSFPLYVSNGPFILKEHVVNSHLLLERNPSYWNVSDPSQSLFLHFSIIPHPTTAYSLFEKKKLDWFGDPCGLCDLEVIEKMNREKTLLTRPAGNIYWMKCNTKHNHLSSPKIRLAIASAINRNDLCFKLLKGGETPAKSILSSFISSIDTSCFSDGDTQFAQKLFEEGLHDLGYTKETFPPLEITHWAEPLSKLMAQCLQQQIQTSLGIPVTLTAYDWSSYIKKGASGDFDLFTAARLIWTADPVFNLNYLKYPDEGINGTGWYNMHYIELLDKADSSYSPQERTSYLQQAELLLAQELPIIPIFEMAFKYSKSPQVAGEVISRAGTFDFKWTKKEKI